MADAITGIPEENNYALDSAYGGLREYIARTGSLPSGYGEQSDAPNLYPDVDPFGVRSTARAEAGDSLATSSTVTGLQLADGTWREREELMKTRLGRDLVSAAEDVRKGHRRGFFEGLFSGSPLEYLPFTQMFASVGGSRWMTSPLDPVRNAGMASSFYDKMVHGKAGEVTEDERLAGTLDLYNRKLSEDGTWSHKVGSILKQAPAFFAEFGILGKVGQAVRAKKIAGIVGQATDAAAEKASVHALTRAAKIGFDEYAEKAVELAATNIKNTTGKTFAQAVRELAASPEARKQMIEKVATSGREMFVEGAANAAANPAKWAPGLAQKVSDIRAARAVESTLSRWSSDHVTTRMWRGLRKSVADSVAEGIMDLGSFGTEASTVITTLEGSAGKAALRGVLDLTVGAAARGSLMYFPKEAVSQMIAAPIGAVNRNKLQLQQAAFLNDDEETFDNAWKTGMFLDLLEYVSENTGRGFGNIGRAIGLKLAPGLMAPARRVAGQNHLVGAAVSRDTAGKISKIEYSGLFDPDRYVEIGGRVNRFLTERFGGKAMREKVINDEMASVTRKLAGAKIKVTNPAALQASLEARAFQPGVSDEIRAAIGPDIKGYVKAAVKEANNAGLEELKLHGTRLFMLADWMTRKQLDPIKAAQYFERVGYDGVVSEMLEERYSDFMGELFGLNARKNTTLMERLTNGLKAAVYINPDTGKFQPGDLLAEAFAFAVPLVARGAVMHGISRLGGASRYEKDVLDWPSLYGDITRYTTAFQGRKGLFIERTAAQRRRLDDKAAELEKKADEEIAARGHATEEGMPPRVSATDAEIQSWRDEAKRYRTASERAGNLFENFIASLAPRTVNGVVTKGAAVSDDAVISAPIYSDEYLLAPDEVYNLALHPTEAQMRGAFSAYERAVSGAAEAIQTQFRMNTKRADESPESFRRIGHWVAETALRLTGFATTGDVGFMAANPARWNAADRGLPDDFLVKGEKMYGNLLAEELSAIQNGKLDRHLNGEEVEGSVTTAEYEAAHERALRRLRPFAETMMRELIASHQTRMFSYDEVEDAAVRDVAADMGMEYDPAQKEFYSINDPESPRMSYDAFVSEKGNRELIESTRRRYVETLYDTLTAGMGVDKQLEVPLSDQTSQLKKPVADILNIPRGLPTEQQVIYARTVERLAARLPQLRNVVTSQTVDPNRTIDDQVAGTAVRQSYLDHVRNAILPDGVASISRAEDVDAALARIDSADPAVVEGIARDLRLSPAYTTADIRRRNREIAMLALRSATVDDPNVALFSRMVDEAERDDRFGNPVSIIAPARRNSKGKWTVAVSERGSSESRPLAADTLDSLAAVLKDRYGYEKVQPKVVYTSTDVFTADTAFDMIRFLGLGNEYRVRMNAAARGNQDYLDPAARTDENGEWAENEDQSAFRRARELRLAQLYEDNRKQDDVWLYLPPGTERTEENRKKASVIKEDAKRAWYRLFERTEDGRAIGYLAVAEDLLAQYGASVKYSLGNRANAFGLVSPAHRSRYSISIRAMHSAGLAQNVYVPISHVNAQDYSSALLEASLATRFSSSRAYLRTFMPQVRTFMDEVRRVCNETAESVRSENPELADKIIALRDATVEHAEGQVRGMTPQTFATFVSAFNLFRTEVPNEWQRSVLGVHAEALVAVAPQVRKLTAYLGWTGVVDRMLGGAGLELEALTGEDVNINAGIARYYALYNPGYVGGGETRRSLKETVDKAFPDGFQAFADSVVNQQQATVAPRFPQSERPAPKEKPKTASRTGTPTQVQEPTVDSTPEPPTEDPIAPLRAAQAKVVQDRLTVEEVMSVINGGNAEEAGTPAETDENGMPVQTDEAGDIDVDPDQFMVFPEPVQAPVVATSAGTKEVTAPPTKSGLLPSEVRTIARAFQRMSTAMLGQQGGLSDLKALVRDKLVPDMTEDDWKALKDAWRIARDDGKYAADWDFGTDKDEEGVMPDGYEGNNARAVEILKSKAMTEFLALMDLVTPTSGRDFQPFAEDMRSNLSASNYLLDNPDADVLDAIGFLTRVANPRAEEDPNGACGRDAKWRHAMSLFDTEDGQRTISRYVRALLGKDGEPPINARGAVLLTYLSMLPTNVRMQLASLLGSCAPATPVRLSLDRSTGKAVFLLREVPKRSGSMSFGVLSSSFARLAGKTANEINAVADDLERSFKATLFAEKVSRKKLVDATGNGVLNAYAKVLAPVFGADSTLVTVLVSSNLRSRLFASRNEGARKEKSEWTRLLEYFAPKTDGVLPDAASVLVETVRGLAAVTKGRADRKALVDRALDMFQSDSPDRRNITGAATSLQGKGIWKMLLQAYAESKPTSIMTAEVNPERTSRPSSSVAITMPGIEPALQQFMDRRSDDLGFEGVLRKWFNGYADMSEDVFKRNVASLRRTMQWPGVNIDPKKPRPNSVVSPCQIVAKSVSKTAMASEVIAGCEAVYELEGAEDPTTLAAKYGELVNGFVKRNMVYVPVYSGDHSSSIIVQVPLAAEFREAGMTYDQAAELVSKWVGLDLLGADAKRSATTSNEGAGTAMWDYAYDEDGNVLKDAEGKDVRGHAFTGILWNSDPDADNEAFIGTTGILGYGADRQKEMAKDPQSGTIKCHVMATGEDTVYGPVLSLIKSLAVSVDGSHGDFLKEDPKRFVNDFAKEFLEGLDGGAKRNSVIWSDFDSIKLGIANSKTIGVSDGAGKSVALMKHVFKQLGKALRGELVGEDGKPVEIGSSVTGAALDKIIGMIDWANFGGTGKKGRYLLSQLLDGVEIREVKREGDYGGHRMFALMFRSDSLQAFTVANVSHHAKSEFSRTPRNYMIDALAIQRTLRTWNADDMNGWGDRRIFNNRDGVCDGLRDLVSGWSLTGAFMSRDPRSVSNLLREDEEYQALIANGEPENGKWAREQRMRVFAANAKKHNLNVPILGTDYALVSNAAWVGKDGKAHSHSSSQMFNDTLQGPRAIAEADREFLRGHRRAGLCNVNCIDASFRYGLYVDDQKLYETFKDVLLPSLQGLTDFRRTVTILDEVISGIVEYDNGWSYTLGNYDPAEVKTWRKKLADCLIDHHGNAFSLRSHPVTIRERNKDGTPKIDPATGKQSRRPGTEFLWKTVSYLDLFTDAVHDEAGRMTFDRTAVYEGMHDSEGNVRTYLGGTMFGFPRTPSYNGSMVFQTLRAALPVTETYDEAKKAEWKPGRDAMVAPDPYTLKVLGCDHDGDKAKLYMLSPVRGKKGQFIEPRKLLGEADALIREIGALEKGFTTVSAAAQVKLDAHVQKLIAEGVLEYERIPDGKDTEGKPRFREGGLVLTRAAQSHVSNAFVQGLFDASRMLPFKANGGESVVAGLVRNGGDNSGSAFGFVTADGGPKWDGGKGPAPNPETAWDMVLKRDGVLGEKIFDVAKGKILRIPRVAARAQDSASRAGDARAVLVSLASAFHMGYMCGFPVGPFASRRNASGKDWIDFMYHLDHLSNMSFDDIKEQICLRLGVTPGMVETIVVDMLNAAGDGRLFTTDAEFMNAFAEYAISVNDPKSSRYWMARAVDPADYEFRSMATISDEDILAADVNPGGGILEANPRGDGSASTFVREVKSWFGGIDQEDRDRFHVAYSLIGALDSRFRSERFGKPDGNGLKDPVNGFVYWFLNSCPKAKRAEALDAFAKWVDGTRSIKEMKALANAINPMGVDPAANDASSTADRLDDDFDADWFLALAGDPSIANKEVPGSGGRRTYGELPEFGTVPGSELPSVLRMRTAAALMYDRGVGEVVAALGKRAHDTYRRNVDAANGRYLLTEPAAGSSTPGALVVHALHVVPRAAGELQLAANAQSVDVALAAFCDVPYVAKSPLNTANMYDVLDKIGRKLAMMRHPETLGSNVTLDVLYGIETMLDVVARFTKNSYAGTQLGIFNYLNEVPNANQWWYDPKKYGGAAKGLSRILLGMGRTGGQIDELRDLVRRVVVNRELDSDGVLGSLPYSSAAVQDDLRSEKHYWKDPQGHKHWREGVDISLALSTENLKKMKALLVGSRSKVMQVNREQAESGTARNLLEVPDKIILPPRIENGVAKDAEVVDANLPGALDELIAVFEMLDKYVAKGFTIEPSALFGQLLPTYAAISSRTEGVPDADSPSLLAMFPETATSWSRLAAKWMSDPRFEPFVMANMAVNWSPRNASLATPREAFGGERLSPAGMKGTKPRRAAEEAAVIAESDLRRLAEEIAELEADARRLRTAGDVGRAKEVEAEAKTARGNYRKAVRGALVRQGNDFEEPSWVEYADPKSKHVLSVFDGARGVLFKNTALVLKGQADTALRVKRTSAVAGPAAAQPVVQPASATPVAAQARKPAAEKQTPAPDDAKPKDAYVQQVADRMAGLMKMWDMGRVEYKGGSTFAIYGRFHESQGLTGGTENVFETRIDVEVLPEGERIADDETLRRVMKSKNYQQSLAQMTGRTLRQIEDMEKAGTLFAFAKANPPGGVSRSFRPGTTGGFVSKTAPGEWRVDAERVGVLTGRIRLARSDEYENVVYHEFFHSVMGFMRTLGSFSQKDIAALQKRYGEDNLLGDKWFNEEKAAEEFRAMVNEGTELDKSVKGIWTWVKDFLNELWSTLTQGAFSPDDYANDLRRNPLASIVLTGRFAASAERKVSEPKDFLGKIDAALKTYAATDAYSSDATDVSFILDGYNASERRLVFDRASVQPFREFLNRINAIGYPERSARNAEIRRIIAEFDARSENMGTLFKNATIAFMKEYGPVSVPAPAVTAGRPAELPAAPAMAVKPASPKEIAKSVTDAETATTEAPAVEAPLTEAEAAAVPVTLESVAETSPTVPNPKHESTVSDLISMPEDSVGASDIAGFLDDAVLDGGDASQFMVAPAVASVRDAMRSVNRMNRPYTRLFSLARQVGLALRDGIENAPEDTVSFLSSLKEVSDYAVGKDRAMAAVRKVASLYGVDISDPEKAENLLFRAMNELAGEIGSECWTKGFGKVRLADGTRASSATHVSPAVLAAAISTSVGVRPRDIAEAAIEDLNSFILRRREDGTTVGRYPEDNTFVVNVINPLVSALTRLSTADPTGLVENTSEGLIDDVLKSMHAGTEPKSGGANSDGTYRDFVISKTPGASKNPYFESNRLRYMDHEGNPDFHKALHRALDAAYMIKAAMKFHKAIGFEPGTVDEMASARQLAPNAPEPLTGAEMASSTYVAPEQLTQDGFQPVYDYDQTWFCANHPLAWLESVSRPGEFGGVDFREMAQGTHRQIAGFHSRANSTNVLMNHRFGLDVLPGQGIHAKVEGRTSDFTRDGGEIRYRGKGKGEKVEKYDAYNGKKAKGADGKTLSLTVNQQRLIDMLLKARKVRYSGGSEILTGVDGITFSLNDLHDADYYDWDKVQARARVGRSLGYSPFDTALVRLHRQLADDVKDVSFLNETLRTRDESWDDIIGKDGLDLYDRLRNAAVAALREAKRLTESRDESGRPMLRPNEVNDFVLGQLEAQGLIVARERLSKELGRHARTEGAVILQVKEIEDLFDRSEAKKILRAAGRTEEELSYEGYAKPFDKIWNEVREFVSSSRFLSDGDGEFFHNMNTPLPFSQGSGFFMYYANRREKGSKLQTDTETMNRWETAFDKLLNSTDLSLPVALADAEQLLLFKELFHTEEKDVESIRSAMVSGDYSRPVEGRRPALSPALTEGATLRDLCKAIYSRMTGMVWKDLGDPTLKESADAVGSKSIGRMVRMYERHRFDDQSLVAGGTGMTDALVYKMTGCLPHNDQLGHAVQRAVDGITNAYAFRATLYNMLTTPDEDGMPICYALPAEDAQDTGGIPDECWGSIADWWAYKNGLSSEIDITKSGVWNARHIYNKIHGGARSNRASGTIEVGGKPFAELAKTDIDQRSIEGFMAQATTPENESKTARLSGFRAGGYALGYAKHLLQSTRGLGSTWQRASIHRVLSYSKGLSVSFGYFFPLTTRFESPIAASGLIATAGGNFTPEFIRERAESLSKLQTLFRGKGWLTKDFTGQRDIFDMLDSNDPYLSELYHWAGALGLTISDANANPYETGRAVLEEDVQRVTEAVRAVFGNKVSRRTNEILKAVLTSGGERAFTYHMNATKLAVASQICTRMQIEAAKDGKAFDPVRDLKKYTNYINSEIGGIDPLEYAWAHPAARNLMTNLFFSWEWTRGSWATGYNVVLEQLLFGGHGVTREQRKFLPGRMARLFLTVGIGYPMMFQLMSKALGELIIAGIDPDDPELDEKTRQLIRMVHETPWWTWQNEDKTSLTAWDVTPLAAAMGAAFPSLRDSVGDHPFLRTVPAIAAFVTHKPWLLALSFPMYTGGGDGNRKTMARRIYAHSGKQLWEDPRWWTDTRNQFFSKLPMPHQRIAESIMGRSLTWMGRELPWNDENDLLRWMNPSMDGALFNLLRAYVPFAATSAGNFGDAGFWTLVGPVQMGASTSDVTKRTASYLDRWSSDDRRGYAFGGPVRSSRKQNYGEIMSKSRPEVAHLVREAMANGVTEKDAYKIVSSAVGKLTGQLISDIVDTMPLRPEDDYDVKKMGKLLRKAQRLGKLPQQIYDSVKDRLVAQSRWGDVTEEAKRRMANIILESREAPYRTDPVKYDY